MDDAVVWHGRPSLSHSIASRPSRPVAIGQCAGAGHIAAAHGTPIEGVKVGGAADAGEWIAGRWAAVVDPMGEIVPAYGFTQTGREVAAARAVKERTLVAA